MRPLDASEANAMQPFGDNSGGHSSAFPAAAITSSGRAPGKKPEALKVFCSYSHEDTPLLEELIKHLKPLELEGLIQLWYDHNITPGHIWEGEIEQHLRSAKIILLLISADFLNSNYCLENELPISMQQYEQGNAMVIPIILRNCDWQHSDFAKLQVLPEHGQPVASWENTDDAFTNVVLNLRRVIDELQQQQITISPLPPKKPDVERRKLLFGLLGLVSLIVIGLFLVRVWSAQKPEAEQQESQDSGEQDVGIRYLTQVTPAAVDAPWQISTFGELKQRVIRGGKLGLFKDLQTNNPYNIYENFLLEINLALLKPGKVAWVIRAVDFNNFYLFELVQPEASKRQIMLKASIWKDGRFFRELQPQAAPVFFSQQEGQPFLLKMLAVGNRFKVCLRMYDDASKYMPFGTIIDSNNTFTYGGIGFFPQADVEFRLAYLYVKPTSLSTDLSCDDL